MNVAELARMLLCGDLLGARQVAADVRRMQLKWEQLERPEDLSARELVVAAAIVELLASRERAAPPSWTRAVGPAQEMIVLDPGLELMPRSFARAKAAGPEPLRRRNLVALPDFLDVA